MNVQIMWEVEDGYVGGNRPHFTDIHLADLAHVESKEELVRLIEAIVRDDFDSRIYETWDENQVDGIWEQLLEWKQEQE